MRAQDFVFGTRAHGRGPKCLALIDEFARDRLAIDVAGRVRPARVIEVLARPVGDECLDAERLRTRAEARVVVEQWRRHFNAVRPHSSLNHLTRGEFRHQHLPSRQRADFQHSADRGPPGQVSSGGRDGGGRAD